MSIGGTPREKRIPSQIMWVGPSFPATISCQAFSSSEKSIDPPEGGAAGPADIRFMGWGLLVDKKR
jgi:hypothetical protein